MSRKATTNSRQIKEFRAVAKELGSEEDPKAFERTFNKMVPLKSAKKAKSKGR